MKTFQFSGITSKTELKLGLIAGVITIFMMAITGIFLHIVNQVNYINHRHILGFVIPITLSVVFFYLRWFGKKLRSNWIIILLDDRLDIKHKELQFLISFNEIQQIILNGGNSLIYFTIKTAKQTIKIRLGTSLLAPFSEQKDLDNFHLFFKNIEPYLNKQFLKKDRRVSLSPQGTIKLTYTSKNNITPKN